MIYQHLFNKMFFAPKNTPDLWHAVDNLLLSERNDFFKIFIQAIQIICRLASISPMQLMVDSRSTRFFSCVRLSIWHCFCNWKTNLSAIVWLANTNKSIIIMQILSIWINIIASAIVYKIKIARDQCYLWLPLLNIIIRTWYIITLNKINDLIDVPIAQNLMTVLVFCSLLHLLFARSLAQPFPSVGWQLLFRIENDVISIWGKAIAKFDRTQRLCIFILICVLELQMGSIGLAMLL